MSSRSSLQGLQVRDWLLADLSGKPVTPGAESVAQQGWATSSAAAIEQLASAGRALGIGAVRLLTVKGPHALTAVASSERGLFLASADPSRPSAKMEQAMLEWSLAPAGQEVADAEAMADAGEPFALEAPAPEESELLLIPIEQPASDPWAQLRRALSRGLLAEAASSWRVIAEAWPAATPGGKAILPDGYERALQTLLEGAGTVLAGDGVGGGRHLRELATLARDQPSFQWLARLWSARAALKSGNLVTATGHAQSALRLSLELDDEARAVSKLAAAEVRSVSGQDPAAHLAGLDEALASFEKLDSAWGLSRSWLAKARIQAALGLETESREAALRAAAADPGWDEPVVFRARRALLRGDPAEAEALLAPLRSPDAARDLGVVAAIRAGEISAEQAGDFLREREAPPTTHSISAMQRIAKTSPGFLQAREALGWIFLKAGKYSEAHAVLHGLLDKPLSPGDRASVLLGLGCIANAAKPGKPEARLRAAVGAQPPDSRTDLSFPPESANPVTAPAPGSPPVPGSVFSGQLGAFALPDLLEFLRSGRRSGLLVCSSHSGMGALRFAAGSITGGAAPGVATLGEILRGAGQIEPAQLEAVMGRQAPGAADPILGEVLVREGLVSPDAVRAAAAKQIRGAVRVLIQWTDGQFAFDREHAADAPRTSTSVALDPQGILLELFREMDEESRDDPATPA